jgi:glycosyltransferase involved in cell wall biosynthesis
MKLEKFSVVISVYRNDNAECFNLAMNSLLDQTVPPDEIVLVVDGPVSSSIKLAISNITKLEKIKTIWLKENVGLAKSRRVAIENTKHNLVAVMDSDDISSRCRFENQLLAFKKYSCDVVGGNIEEFVNTVGDLGRQRVVPRGHDAIVNLSRWRNPINHVTLMFRKDSYLRVGGYSKVRHSEDWDLIVRMILDNAKIINLSKILVYVQAGVKMIERRRRWTTILGDFKLFKIFYDIGHISLVTLLINVLGRLILRLLPARVTSLVYEYFLRINK